MTRSTAILLSPPWPLFNRPSIQLGALTAYARFHGPKIPIEPVHAYLDVASAVGYRRAEAIARHSWLAEAILSPALFPEMTDPVRDFFQRRARSESALRGEPFDELAAEAKGAFDTVLDAIEPDGALLVGISVCLCQWTAAFYAAHRLRQRHGVVPVVLGGSLMASQSASSLMSAFSCIDAIVVGEGERPLVHLLHHLAGGKPMAEVTHPSILVRGQPDSSGLKFDQLPDLAALPEPEFDEYFHRLGRLPSAKQFFPILPVEASRGCWWRRVTMDGAGRGCAFCNLNGQWSGYRAKSSKAVAKEVDRLTDRHRLVEIAFTDNALPPGKTGELAGALKELNKDLSLFGEVRAAVAPRDLAALARAGMSEIQVGIESLATSLLKKMNKGVRAIENMAVMRACEALGVRNGGNLIVQFPGSDDADVNETLRVIEAACVYAPLKAVRFWLGLGSPVWGNPKAYGIRAVMNHPDYRWLLPERIRREIPLPSQGYRGDVGDQQRRWKPVRERLARWASEYARLHAGPRPEPILSYRDGGNFLLIRHRRLEGPPRIHRLVGISRRVYLACRQPRHIDSLLPLISGADRQQMEAFLSDLASKGILFRESDYVLSLAVRSSATAACRDAD